MSKIYTEPKKVTRIIHKVSYHCGISNHIHKTKVLAQACIDRQLNRESMSLKSEIKPIAPSKSKDVLAHVFLEYMRKDVTYKMIGDSMGYTAERIRQYVIKQERLLRHPAEHGSDDLRILFVLKPNDCIDIRLYKENSEVYLPVFKLYFENRGYVHPQVSYGE